MFKFLGLWWDFWVEKIVFNKIRDIENKRKLIECGWRVVEVWECVLRGKRCFDIEEFMDEVIKWLKFDDNFCQIEGYLE